MEILLSKLNERYYYGECLNNGSLFAIEKVKELMLYKKSMAELLESIEIEIENFKKANSSESAAKKINVKGYLLELNFIKNIIFEITAA